MNAVVTAPDGVINRHTIFTFAQSGNNVWADYCGGRIERGYLVGTVIEDRLAFWYCQLTTDGTLDGGKSECDLERTEDGRVRIVEHFEWESREGSGANIIEELPHQ